MRHTTIGGHHRAHDVEAAAFWIFAAVIVVIAFSEVLALLAVGFAIVTAAWWISHHRERRAATSVSQIASVTRLLPAPSDHHEVAPTSPAPWRGPSAA
jgi:hypothetical protein